MKALVPALRFNEPHGRLMEQLAAVVVRGKLRQTGAIVAADTKAQAIAELPFCIDVRSYPFRSCPSVGRTSTASAANRPVPGASSTGRCRRGLSPLRRDRRGETVKSLGGAHARAAGRHQEGGACQTAPFHCGRKEEFELLEVWNSRELTIWASCKGSEQGAPWGLAEGPGAGDDLSRACPRHLEARGRQISLFTFCLAPVFLFPALIACSWYQIWISRARITKLASYRA